MSRTSPVVRSMYLVWPVSQIFEFLGGYFTNTNQLPGLTEIDDDIDPDEQEYAHGMTDKLDSIIIST
jgi:hypothetical protein